MEVRAGTISFHAPMSLTRKYGQNAANADGVPILLWMLPITPASEVCNEEGMTQTKARHVSRLMDKSLFGRFRSILGCWL